MPTLRWKCKDRRYTIQKLGQPETSNDTILTSCLWYSNYSFPASQLECVLTYCDNATEEPNISGRNYNFTWDGGRILLGEDVFYPCKVTFYPGCSSADESLLPELEVINIRTPQN